MSYEDVLKEYGLSDNEVKIYLTILKIGESTVQKIAKNSEIVRTTTYNILESLQHKGLISFVVKEKIKHFQAADPRVIPEILEEKRKRIKEILPELLAITETIKDKPKVMVYEGTRGIKTILEDVLHSKQILHYGDINSLQMNLKYIFPQFIAKRISRKIPIKIVCKREDAHKELIKNAKKEKREFVFVQKKFVFKSSVFIFNDKVAILCLQEEPFYGIIIQNEDFYETQKSIFELLWKSKHS